MTNASGQIVRLRAVVMGAMVLAGAAAACTGDIGAPLGGGVSMRAAGGGTSSSASATGGGGGNGGGPVDIGFATAERLNRTQYNNTVHDLLGTSQTPANSFPPDETDRGYDTISATLTLQPAHVEQYLAAAQTLVTEFLARPANDPRRTRYLTCDYTSGNTACLQQILVNFASKAWRRPVETSELAPYLALAAAQPTPQAGLNQAMEGVLISAKFIYRLEFDPNPDNTTMHSLSAYELASRLSYLLWSSMPDDALFAAAASGALLTNDGLKAQVTRMIAMTDKSQEFPNTFGTEWLGLNQLMVATPDPKMFPNFDSTLSQSMIAETTDFLLDFFNNDLPLSQLLTANFTYVNSTLAAFYGLPAVQGTALQRVSTAGTHRGGLLTQGTYLAGYSNPTSTSPVKRGLYVLARLMCSSPPAPPAGINTNLAQEPNAANLSVREQLMQHEMLGPVCASCHVAMDPIGLAMENFDAIGQYRTSDSFGAIDATGTIPSPTGSGTVSFDGQPQLVAILATDPRVAPCAIQQLVTFAIGRPFASLGGPATDTPILNRIAARATSGGQSFESVLGGLTQDDIFRSRRAASPTEVTAQAEVKQ
jgi:hypothetical protein